MKTRNLKLVCLLLETVGIAALFLPFVLDFSPWRVLAESVQNRNSGADGAWPLALPAFLAFFVWLLTLRSLFNWPLRRAESWLHAGLAVPVMFVSTGFWLPLLEESANEWKLVLLVVLFLGLALSAAGLLLILRRRGTAFGLLAPLALRCAYIPNAVFCLLFFSRWGHDWSDLRVGAACVGATVILYLVEIVYLTKQGLTDRPATAP
jgi:hypothetical protein